MDIYSILASKPHNPHYLNRYITFIEQCQRHNDKHEEYVENHHICPKAKDMFPEYKDFRKHPWNKAVLTPRQHFIAHLILWKSFFASTSQCHAAWQMKHKNKMPIISRTYESLKFDFRKLSAKIHTGMVVVKDVDGNKFKVSTNDPRYISGELVSPNTGTMGVKDVYGNTFSVSTDDPRYISGELVPIIKGMTWKIEDTSNYRKPKSKSHIENIKKWVSVTDPNTMERKRVLRTDHLYVSGYYKGASYGMKKTEEQRKEISSRFRGKTQVRCSCVLCRNEVSVNNLNRHFGSGACCP